MKIESKPLRYAHAEGHTDVCYTENGKHIITCGHDGDVRIWVDIEDDDPNSHCVGESALSLFFKESRLYVSTDNHAVQAYTFPAFDKDGIVTRFTAPVTQIKSTSKIEALGCCSENMEAKICSLEGGAPLFVMSEHKGPVLSIAICPHMKFASTACGDGQLRIWDVDTQKIVKEITCVPKINTFFAAKVLCRMDFEPLEGKYLAYPNNREVILLDCESWGQRMSFTHDKIKCAISQCLFSPCGKYLASSTVAGQIAVWEIETGSCIDIIEHPTSHNISAMAWNPKGNGVLVYCDVAGQLGSLVNCYGIASGNGADDNIEGAEIVERVDDDVLDDLIENYESDDDNAISLEKIKNETLGLTVERDESRPVSRQTAPAPSTVPPQSPFQPSSSPSHLEHSLGPKKALMNVKILPPVRKTSQHREEPARNSTGFINIVFSLLYMCWNDVGIVRCHTVESGESTIDVEFHDTTMHHGIHLNNYLNHTMASLSSSVLALACETPSKLVCISLVGSSKEWSVSMPDTEEILCVMAASGVVACATNARLLRLFTVMGTQRQVISLAGPVVTLAGYNTTVLAVYHSTDPGTADQHLTMDIIALNGRQVRSKSVPLPLTPGSKLNWLGTTDVGSPCAYDNTGILRMYDLASGVWMPICDSESHSRGASDTWFIVSISEPTQKVRAISCRGTSYPLTVPKPIITELSIQIPLCEMDSEKSQYEEQLVRWAHTTADVDVKTARETALKLFALACKSEIEQRALELMELLKDDRLLPLAAKYASRLGRIHLADKLTNLSATWDQEADRLNTARNPHFQELDTQEMYDVTSSEQQDLNTSLIIPQKIKEKKAGSITPIKPVPIKSSPGGARNPFRKQQENTKNIQSPLTLTERTLVQVHSSAEDAIGNGEVSEPLEGESFTDWFTRNKSLLELRNPELTPSELIRHEMRTFRTAQIKPTTTSSDSNGKRKLNDETNGVEAPITSAPKQSKLSAFAFHKKT